MRKFQNEFNDYINFGEKRYTLSKKEKSKIYKHIKNYLIDRPEIKFAYIHGSFLETFPCSDIDVAVYYEDTVPAQKFVDFSLTISAELSHILHLPVDVHALNQATPGFCYEATKGKVIFSRREEEMFEFIENTWMIYFDFKPLLEQNLDDLLAK